MVKNGKKWHCHGGSCYHFPQNEKLIKDKAEEKCQQLGGHIVALETAEEQEAVLEIMNAHGLILNKFNSKTPKLFLSPWSPGRGSGQKDVSGY